MLFKQGHSVRCEYIALGFKVLSCVTKDEDKGSTPSPGTSAKVALLVGYEDKIQVTHLFYGT